MNRTPYLDLREVADRYRIKDQDGQISPRVALKWIKRAGIPFKKRGRVVIVHEDDIEAALTVKTA